MNKEEMLFTLAAINYTVLTNNVEVVYQHEDGHLEKVSHEQYLKDYVHFFRGLGEYNGKKLKFSEDILDPIRNLNK
jgi:hypothetical protein